MIMPNSTATLDTNAESTSFGIEMNSSMFQMLTKNVYNDVILAPIREFSTNAIDACLAAKSEIKFDVHLPTQADQMFSVRDYGTGLDHDDITGLFSLLGASTKRGSNEYNGTFGIGRMSGLAYTDSFSIDSYYNGKKLSYVVSMNDGIPNTVHLGDVDTNEPNGLKLSLKVKYKDIMEFQRKAGELYRFFEHKPNLNVTLDLELEKVINGGSWYTSNDVYGAYILMGNVPYKLDQSHINDNLAREVMSANPIIEASLGAVSITPGRESLTMDEDTVKYVTDRLLAIREEIMEKAKESIDETADNYDKLIQVNHVQNQLPYYLRRSFTYDLSTEEEEVFSMDSYGVSFKRHAAIPDARLMMLSNYNVTPKNLANEYNDPSLDKLKFMIGDTRTFVKDAAINYRSKFSGSPHIVLVQMEKYKKDEFEDFIDNAIKVLEKHGIPYVKASDYNADVKGKERTTVTGFHPLSIDIYSTDNATCSKGYSKIDAYDPEKTFFVPTKGYELQEPIEKVNKYIRYMKLYNTEHSTNYRVIGVPQKHISNVEEAGFQKLEELKNLPETINFYEGSGEYRTYINLLYQIRKLPTKQLAIAIYNDTIRKYFKTMNDYDSTYTSASYPTDGLADTFKTATIVPSNTTTLEKLEDQYPMFNSMITYCTMSEFNRYIKLEDAYNEVHQT